MNIVVCDNIKEVAMQLHKQIEHQILDPSTNKMERERLIEAQKSMGGAIRFLLQAMGLKI